jgi:hypothetical protein
MSQRRSDEIAGELSGLMREIEIQDENVEDCLKRIDEVGKQRDYFNNKGQAARAKLSQYLRHLKDGESVHAFTLSREKSKRTFALEDGLVSSATSVDVFHLAERIAEFETNHKDQCVSDPACPCRETFPAPGIESAEFGPFDTIDVEFMETEATGSKASLAEADL